MDPVDRNGDLQPRVPLRCPVKMADDDGGYGSSSSFSCLVNDCENGISRFALDLVYR